jgi:hypothetical protein
MLTALSDHGYQLTATQLRNLRLHESLRLLHGRSLKVPLDEIREKIARAIQNGLFSGQTSRWGYSYLAPYIRRETGTFISR